MNKAIVALLATTSALVSVPAQAQNVPAFRVPLAQMSSSTGLDPVFSWIEHNSDCSTSCGTGTRTTSYQCQDVTRFDLASGDYGAPEPAGQCVSVVGPAPANTSATCTNLAGCSFDWVKPPEKVTVHPVGSNPVGRPGCGDVQREFDPSCRRGDGTALAKGDHAFCRNDLPDYNDVANGNEGALGYDRRSVETASCNASDHQWVIGAWGPWTSTCSTTATHTRVVTCKRKFDGSTQADAACPQPKPATSETQPQYGSCTYSRVNPGAWGAWSSGCDSEATRSRTYQCRRSDGTIVGATECTSRGINLSESETSAQYGSCSYSRGTAGAWGAWSSGCDSAATRSRTFQCRRSDGTNVAASECSSRGISLTESETSAQYGSCSYRAVFGAWSGWSSDCSATASRTRSVRCERANNGGTTVANSECTTRNIALTPTSETAGRYGSCTYSRVNPGAWGAWSSGCDSAATRSRTYQCRRSDGTIVAATECSSRGINLSESETGAQYGSCAHRAVFGAWSGWSSDCSPTALRTRSVRCERTNNGGSTVADSECTTRNIALTPTSETAARYGSCSYTAVNPGAWGAWNSGCSASASSTRTYQCRRSDGTIVAASECTSRGVSVTEARTSAQYGSCTYAAANPGAWSNWASGCSSSTTRTRTSQCRRSDGTVVAASECTNRGIALVQTQSGENYASCTYQSQLTSRTCTAPGIETRTYACIRSDYETVASSYCGRSSATETVASSNCVTHAWSAGDWSAWGACNDSGQRTRTRSVTCRSNAGATVADSNCTGTKPVASETGNCPTIACTPGSRWMWTGTSYEDYNGPNWTPLGGINRAPTSAYNLTNQTRVSSNRQQMVTGITAIATYNNSTRKFGGSERCP